MVKKYLFSPKLGFIYVRVKVKYLGRINAPKGSAECNKQYTLVDIIAATTPVDTIQLHMTARTNSVSIPAGPCAHSRGCDPRRYGRSARRPHWAPRKSRRSR